MTNIEQQLWFAQKALNLTKALNSQPGTSYMKALRTSASEVLGQDIGRAIPVKNESKLKHIVAQAEKNNRPFFVVTSDESSNTFVLLVDTYPKK